MLADVIEMEMIKNRAGSVIVSWDFSKGEDVGVLLVGRQKPGRNVEIINAFQGEDAEEIYKKLTTVNEVLTKKGE